MEFGRTVNTGSEWEEFLTDMTPAEHAGLEEYLGEKIEIPTPPQEQFVRTSHRKPWQKSHNSLDGYEASRYKEPTKATDNSGEIPNRGDIAIRPKYGFFRSIVDFE